LEDKLATIGGLLGLCAGISILSVAEVLYWGILIIFKTLGRQAVGKHCTK
jgi:hypothetical protein